MQLFRGIPAQTRQGSVLTIGNFDGVHLGHQALLRQLTATAHALSLPAVALSFEPHPREFLFPDRTPARLASLREKILGLTSAGVDRIHICRFNRRLAEQSAAAFIEDVLLRGLGVRHLLIGDDFRFGAAREGDFTMLEAAGRRHGFSVEAMPTLAVDGERVSSSAVRAALAEGRLDHAARLLGRVYSIAGRVIHGDKIGRTLGFPTANILMKHRKPALSGVFAVRVEGLTDHPVAGAASIGLRPSVSSPTPTPRLEVHLLDWHRACYGAHLRVHFIAKLRDEIRHPDLEALRAQIARDIVQCRDILARNPQGWSALP